MAKQTIPNNGIQNAVGNIVYPDLVLTRWPEYFDERSGAKNNPNMHRWLNLEDYNMSEHVNAISDAIMALQRALGENPQISTDPVDENGNPISLTPEQILNLKKTQTIKRRIDILEKRNFDKRYGGPNWKPEDKQTLEEHKHTGKGPGHPSKIDLTQEVQGKLPKANIDTSQNATGLTGADLFINATKKVTVDASLNDKLSQAEGGTIKKDLAVEGRFQSRTNREYDFNDLSGTKVGDTATLLNYAMLSHDTNETVFIKKPIEGLYYGRYVLVVRAKTNNRVTGNILELSTTAQANDAAETMVLKGTDFKTAGVYQNFYLSFTHEPNVSNSKGEFKVRKLATTDAVKVSLDYVLIMPTHPGIFNIG